MLTYSIVLYTCAKAHNKLLNYLSSYDNILKAHDIVYKLLGKDSYVTKKYLAFLLEMEEKDEVKDRDLSMFSGFSSI